MRLSRCVFTIFIVFLMVFGILMSAGMYGNGKSNSETILTVKGLANSPWPMFHGNAKHTGQSPYDTTQNGGHLKWKFKTGGAVESSPVIGSDGTIYVGSDDYYLYAINPDGTLKWKFKTGGAVKSTPAIGDDGTIYVGSEDYSLYAINPDGSLKWKYETGGRIDSSPVIGRDGTIYVGSEDYYLYAINLDGTLKWRFQTEGKVDSSPAIGDDGTIYVGSEDHYLYAINLDGTLKWKFDTGYAVTTSPAIGKVGEIYIGSGSDRDYSGYLYAINPNGTLKWKFETGGAVKSTPAIGSDGTIYVGMRDIYVVPPSPPPAFFAINPDATVKWWEYMSASSVTIGSDGTIYVGSENYCLYAINPNGTLKWKFETGEAVKSTPAIGSDGKVYVGSDDCYLYAISSVPPSPPRNLESWEDDDGNIVIKWSTPKDDGGCNITSFKVYVFDGGKLLYEMNTTKNRVTISASSLKIEPSLFGGTKDLDVRVIAKNKVGESEMAATTVSVTRPIYWIGWAEIIGGLVVLGAVAKGVSVVLKKHKEKREKLKSLSKEVIEEIDEAVGKRR